MKGKSISSQAVSTSETSGLRRSAGRGLFRRQHTVSLQPHRKTCLSQPFRDLLGTSRPLVSLLGEPV